MTFVLDHKTLSAHRAGRVLALDERALGSSVTLRSERPSAEAQRRAGAAAGAPRKVAVVDIIGPLAQRGEAQVCGFVDGYDWIGERLGAALEGADAVVLRIDSPGGDVAGLAEGVRRMRAAVEAAGVPVVAYVDELAASAAYWIAAGVADEIVVPPMGKVGSIGSFGVLVDLTKQLADDGVSVTVVRSPDGKAEAHPAAPIADLARERLGAEVADATARFIDAIAARRGLSATVLWALNGAVLRGQDAVAAGLADRVGTLEDTIRGAVAPREQRAQMMQQQTTKAEDPKQPSEEPKAVAPVPVEDGQVTCPGCGMTFPVAMPEQAPPTEEAAAALELERNLLALTGERTPMAALATVAEWKARHADTSRRERADLVAELVRAGGALPSDAWADPVTASDPEKRSASKLFASMPVEELRARVQRAQAVPTAFRRFEPQSAAVGLTPEELESCKRYGRDPADFARDLARSKGAAER